MKADTEANENTRKILRKVFEPVIPSTAYRDQLLQKLLVETSGIKKVSKPTRNNLLLVS